MIYQKSHSECLLTTVAEVFLLLHCVALQRSQVKLVFYVGHRPDNRIR